MDYCMVIQIIHDKATSQIIALKPFFCMEMIDTTTTSLKSEYWVSFKNV